MSILFEIAISLSGVCSFIWECLTIPLNEFLYLLDDPVGLIDFILELVEFTGLSDFLSEYSLLTLFLGVGLPLILIYNLIKWLIPV